MARDPVVSPSELADLLRAGHELVLLDCRPEPTAYAEGHLEGARHVELERDLSRATAPDANPARGGRHPLPRPVDFARTLGALGITPNTHVIAYDAQGGANAAARLWWMLRAFGHERVQVVDGGVSALRDAGFAFVTELPKIAPAEYPTRAWQRPTADVEEVERARSASRERVLDVRAAFRFRGESEPIDPIAGHIPGAHNLPFSENLDAHGRFKSADELRALYARFLGDLPPEQLIVHCGSGVTACHTLLALERAGIEGAKLYVGSWSEWCRRPELPRANGDA